MTERKFTPPTEFPAEYVTGDGQKAVILGRAPVGDYPLIGYIIYTKGESAQPNSSSSDGWTEDGENNLDWSSPDDLHDIPKRISTWHNVYSCSIREQCTSRRQADAYAAAYQKRLCVYRIERDEDGSNPEIFEEEV